MTKAKRPPVVVRCQTKLLRQAIRGFALKTIATADIAAFVLQRVCRKAHGRNVGKTKEESENHEPWCTLAFDMDVLPALKGASVLIIRDF